MRSIRVNGGITHKVRHFRSIHNDEFKQEIERTNVQQLFSYAERDAHLSGFCVLVRLADGPEADTRTERSAKEPEAIRSSGNCNKLALIERKASRNGN
jgi:hypothetical protein